MEDVFPMLAGVAIGLATLHLRRNWLSIALVGTLGIAFGAVASWISGELAISWIYLLIDTAGHRRKRHDRGSGQGLAPPPPRPLAR
jgi:hypothetical protein